MNLIHIHIDLFCQPQDQFRLDLELEQDRVLRDVNMT